MAALKPSDFPNIIINIFLKLSFLWEINDKKREFKKKLLMHWLNTKPIEIQL